jgi:WD40 repeat protein
VITDVAGVLTGYLREPADGYWAGEAPAGVRHAVRLGEPLFALVAALAADRDIASLERLYFDYTRLHAVIDDEVGFRGDKGFADRAGAPFRKGDNAGVHAVRALAGLGLALTGEVPPELPLRSALSWYADARGSLGAHRWDPREADWGESRLSALTEMLAGAAGHEDSAGAALTTALTLRELATWVPNAPEVKRGKQASVTVLLARGGEGVRARLQASVAKGLPPGLVPDPRQMALFSADPGFQRSLDTAWSQAGTGRAGGTVLWSVKGGDGHSPRIEGESAGAALATVLDEVGRLSRPLAGLRVARRLEGSTAIVGRIDNLGYLQSVEGYDAKLAALRRDSRVIVPAADTERASNASVRSMEIIPATRWSDAARKARHRNGKVMLRRGVAAAIVLALIAGGVALAAHAQALAERLVADSGTLAAQSQATGATDPALARLEAVAAWNLAHTPDAQYAVLKAAMLPATLFLGSDNPRIDQVAFSHDDDLLADSTTDGGIQVWDMATRGLAVTVPADPGGSVQAVAFSPADDGLLADTTLTGYVQLWDVPADRLVDTFRIGGPSVALAFSPDGSRLAIGTYTGGLELWDVATHQMRTVAEGDNDPGQSVGSVAFSPDGSLVAATTEGIDAQVWDVATGQLVTTLGSREDPPEWVTFSPADDGVLAIGNFSGRIELRSTGSYQLVATLMTSDHAPVYSLAFSPDGGLLASGDEDGNAQLWDVATQQLVTTLRSPDGSSVADVAFSPDGEFLADGTHGGTLELANVAAGSAQESPVAVLRPGTAGDDQVTGIAFSANGHLLAVDAQGGGVLVWNMATQRLAVTVAVPASRPAASMAFSPDGQFLAVGTFGATELWNVATGKLAATLPAGYYSKGIPNNVDAVAFSPDGKLVAADTGFSGVQVWQVAAPHHLYVTLGASRTARVSAIAFSPDSNLLAAGTSEGGVQVWQMTSHYHLKTTLGSDTGSSAESVAFSPDGSHLAEGSGGGVQVWNLTAGGPAVLLQAAASAVTVAFGLGGTVLAVATSSEVQLWDIATDEEIGAIPAAYAGAASTEESPPVAFSPSSAVLATGTAGEVTQLWSLSFLSNALSYLCSLTGESFPVQQWEQYAPGVPYQKTCQ